MTDDAAVAAARQRAEKDRAYARRIVRAHQHAHGPKEVRCPPEKCARCRDLIDVITLALTTRTALAKEETLPTRTSGCDCSESNGHAKSCSIWGAR